MMHPVIDPVFLFCFVCLFVLMSSPLKIIDYRLYCEVLMPAALGTACGRFYTRQSLVASSTIEGDSLFHVCLMEGHYYKVFMIFIFTA